MMLLGGCASRSGELTANGTIEATEIKVVAEVGGRLNELLVKEGDRVKEGQLVGWIEDQPFRYQVDQARAGVAAAKAALDETGAGARGQEVEAAQREVDRLAAQVAAAREQLSLQEDNLKRAEALFDAEALPEQELVARQSQVRLARHQLEATEAQLEAARSRLSLLEAGSRQQTLERLAAGVNQAEANLALAQLNLEKTKLVAPAAGMVAARNFEKGELIRPGAEVITLLDDRNLWLNVFVPEDRLSRVRVGQAVRITVDTHPNRSFPGKVVYISPRAEFTPRNVQTKQDRVNLVFRVKIEATGGRDALRPGLPADVTFPF
jgi:HlyD family secretion protein